MKRILLTLCMMLGLLAPVRAADSTVQSMTASGAIVGGQLLYCPTTTPADFKCTFTQVATFLFGLVNSGLTCTSAGVCTPTEINPHPGYIAGASEWYLPDGVTPAGANGVAATINVFKCHFGSIDRQITIAALGGVSSTNGTTSVQYAIYANSGGRPGTLIQNTAALANNAGPGAITGSITAALVGPGSANGAELWWCFNSGDSTVIMNAVAITGSFNPAKLGSTTLTNVISVAAQIAGISCTSAGTGCGGGTSTYNSGTPNWPASFVGTVWTDVVARTVPVLALQVQ